MSQLINLFKQVMAAFSYHHYMLKFQRKTYHFQEISLINHSLLFQLVTFQFLKLKSMFMNRTLVSLNKLIQVHYIQIMHIELDLEQAFHSY